MRELVASLPQSWRLVDLLLNRQLRLHKDRVALVGQALGRAPIHLVFAEESVVRRPVNALQHARIVRRAQVTLAGRSLILNEVGISFS